MTVTAQAPQTAAEQFPLASRMLAGLAVPKNDRMPADMAAKLQMADMFVRSGLCPRGMDTKEKVFVALQFGDELGLAPWISIQNCAVIQGRPSMGAHIMVGVAQSANLLDGWDTTGCGDTEAVVRARRRGSSDVHIGKYTLDDAKRAGLLGKDNWRNFPADMLYARAAMRALRRACPEVFAGLVSKEELEDTSGGGGEAQAAPAAWAMDAKRHGELKAYARTREVPDATVKEIVARVTEGRKIERANGVPQYTQTEYEAIVAEVKAWTAPTAAPAGAPPADTPPADAA